MELTNDFRVSLPVEQAWAVLVDVERIAPCLPGAELQEVEGDEYRGVVKVKVGPITAQYRGKATFLERDDQHHKAVLRAEGRETRGQGNANATITSVLEPDGDDTRVSVTTDLTVTGRVAQFGRGVLADVSAKLLTQFVQCLESTVLSSGGAGSAGGAEDAPDNGAQGPTAVAGAPGADGDTSGGPEPSAVGGGSVAAASTAEPSGVGGGSVSAPAGTSGVRTIASGPAEPVDLMEVAGGSVARRALPAVGGLLALLMVLFLWRRRRG